MFKKIWQFFIDTKAEFAKVSWPSREELTQSTLVVMVVSLAVTVFIALVDQGLTRVITLILG
ncbi:preprotein translocase subunit SecE [candidate division TA06 bacterium]|uniref:Protein translocase subunit SecE n=1 Tax=candidate division TA06 bacterium TaxID=2250710 RepID=A0A933IDS6_UNCT6|nr:preprotein translocase subunit SecE [candidate division TA06 bacterium]